MNDESAEKSSKQAAPHKQKKSLLADVHLSPLLLSLSFNIIALIPLLMFLNIFSGDFTVGIVKWYSVMELDPTRAATPAHLALWITGLLFCIFIVDNAILVLIRITMATITLFKVRILLQTVHRPTMESVQAAHRHRSKHGQDDQSARVTKQVSPAVGSAVTNTDTSQEVIVDMPKLSELNLLAQSAQDSPARRSQASSASTAADSQYLQSLNMTTRAYEMIQLPEDTSSSASASSTLDNVISDEDDSKSVKTGGSTNKPAGSTQQLHTNYEYPRVVVQLPMYNEVHVARRVISLSCQLKWPRDRLLIQVLDDSTSQQAREAVNEEVELQQRKGMPVQLLRREDRRGFKAGALNDSMSHLKGYEYIAVLDADFVPSADFLLQTVPYLEENRQLAFVQARWSYLNADQSVLTKVQHINLDFHHLVEQKVRSDFGMFFNFCGTAGVIRKCALEAVGGWSEKTVVEDMEMSLRMYTSGWKLLFLDDVHVPCELPSEYKAYFTQQRRWIAGPLRILTSWLTWLSIWQSKNLTFSQKLTSTFFFVRMLKSVANLIFLLVAVPISVFWADGLLQLYLFTVIPLIVTVLSFAYSTPWALLYWPMYMAFEIGFSFFRFKSLVVGIIHGYHSRTWVVTFKSGGLVSSAKVQAEQAVQRRSGRIRFAELVLAGYMMYVGVVAFQAYLFFFSGVIFFISLSYFWIGVCQSSLADWFDVRVIYRSLVGRHRCVQPQILSTLVFVALMLTLRHLIPHPSMNSGKVTERYVADVNYQKHFLRTSGSAFAAGDFQYTLAGANLHYLFYEKRHITDAVLEQLTSAGLNVIRAWAFLDVGKWDDVGSIDGRKNDVFFQMWDSTTGDSIPREDPTFGLGRMDEQLALIGSMGLKVIMTITNNWYMLGGAQQLVKYAQWYRYAHSLPRDDYHPPQHDDFFSHEEIKRMYRKWAHALVNRTNTITGVRYADDPTIAAWELINEPRCDTVGDKCNQTIINEWIREMADYVHELDNHHLVTVDFPESYWANLSEANMTSQLGLDFVSFHVWPDDLTALNRTSAEYFNDTLRKIELIGSLDCGPKAITEFGFVDDLILVPPVKSNSSSESPSTIVTRQAAYHRVLTDAFVRNNVSMFAFWMYNGYDNHTAALNFDHLGVYGVDASFATISDAVSNHWWYQRRPVHV